MSVRAGGGAPPLKGQLADAPIARHDGVVLVAAGAALELHRDGSAAVLRNGRGQVDGHPGQDSVPSVQVVASPPPTIASCQSVRAADASRQRLLRVFERARVEVSALPLPGDAQVFLVAVDGEVRRTAEHIRGELGHLYPAAVERERAIEMVEHRHTAGKLDAVAGKGVFAGDVVVVGLAERQVEFERELAVPVASAASVKCSIQSEIGLSAMKRRKVRVGPAAPEAMLSTGSGRAQIGDLRLGRRDRSVEELCLSARRCSCARLRSARRRRCRSAAANAAA